MTTPEQRRRSVTELVTKHGGLSVDELASRLEVSPSTIRRDLSNLAERNLVERTHGGAVPVTNVGVERSFNRRLVQHLDRKQAIAERAVKEIQEGQVIYFDAGTTTMQVAKEVPDVDSTISVTNSPLLLPELAKEDRTVKSTGGEYRPETKALVGPTAEEYIRNSHFDLAFIGINGIGPDGTLSAPNEAEAELKRLVVEHAARTVVVTVTEKLGEQSFRRFGSIDDVDLFVTDGRVPEDYHDLFEETALVDDLYK
ncbi:MULTISPECIES: HTH-type transcriptional regulator GlpR [Haloferax]|uniref:DeoR family transcriptional regulator n=2 Tax=Haloferax TaxID=2251 RepID=A0A6G1Z5Z5_9EURY|nr:MULTISPECIES: HTH-type transcriptional regulator GlpR [Haloferax]KAB1185339.1 DeoR/GlpR transcriptional regulator [Haloferax sp. CBA1149]MRW81976.1 DeoR family transcriptional regulator [Haloferax marinisediminis]